MYGVPEGVGFPQVQRGENAAHTEAHGVLVFLGGGKNVFPEPQDF